MKNQPAGTARNQQLAPLTVRCSLTLLLAALAGGPGCQGDAGAGLSDAGPRDGGAASDSTLADQEPQAADEGWPPDLTRPAPDLGHPWDAGPSGDAGPELVIPPGCNPLAADWDCLLPYPSDVFRQPVPGQPGQFRLVHPAAGLPHHVDTGVPIDFTRLHPADGFSHLPPILALFPEGVASGRLIFHTGDVTRTLGPESHTSIIEAATGAFVLHFAELDPRTRDRSRQALVLRPLVRLQNSTRYIVALHGLVNPRGGPLTVPEGFRRIRDGQAGDHPILGPLAERYERELFPVLAAAGVARSELQLAWDFTTESTEQVQGDLRAVRADLLVRLDAAPPPVVITEVRDDVDEHIFRRIKARMTVPLYLTAPGPESPLHRDETGRVTANGTVEVPLVIQLPRRVAEGPAPRRPARLLQFGHGFFANVFEADGAAFPRAFANEYGFVLAATDWWGMCDEDQGSLMTNLYANPAQAFAFVDRVHQGMANFLALGYALRESLVDEPALRLDGALVYDPAQLYFYGVSQGHILGGTFLALSPHIERGVLASGGAAFSFMMLRSMHFTTFLLVLNTLLPDPLELQKFVALSQTTLDRIDPITYAPLALDDPLPGSPVRRRILMQIGLGDTSVPNLASHLHARALGLSLLEPAVRPLPALPTAASPWEGSALVEHDYGLPAPLPGDVADPPTARNEVHDGLRRNPRVQQQVNEFLSADGEIRNCCDGPCDPE